MTFNPLNEDQVRVLLGVAMSYDHRNPGESDVMAWMEAARRARWRFVPARDAIHEHYAASSKFVMPGDVTQRLKVESRFPSRFGEAPREIEGPPPEPAQPERVRAIVQQLASRLGWRTPASQDTSLEVECPHCHASPQRPCTILRTRGPHRGEYVKLAKSHPSRVDLATKMREAS